MHPNRREELDLFKSRFNLTEYASAQGYVLDRKHSSRNSVAMQAPAGDKVIMARDARDGNWIYFSVADLYRPLPYAVFPHRDRNGICGFEIRNYRFRGFSKGGEKGLWYSRALPEDTTLIICESGIDVLSYHALHRPAQAHYFSIASEMNPMQRILLASAMQKLPVGAPSSPPRTMTPEALIWPARSGRLPRKPHARTSA